VFLQQLHSSLNSMFSGSSCTASNSTVRIPPHEALQAWLSDHGCNCYSQPPQPEEAQHSAACERAAVMWPAAKGLVWMQCGIGIALVSVEASHYTVVTNATLPHDIHVVRAHATPRALFVFVSVSAVARQSSTVSSLPEGVWRVTVSHSSRGPFLRLRVIPCPAFPITPHDTVAFASHASGTVMLFSSTSLLTISSSLPPVRYVRFQSRSPEGHFQVSYVSVHAADGTNVADGKPVSVSASYPEGAAPGDVVRGQPEARNHPVMRLCKLGVTVLVLKFVQNRQLIRG